MDVIGEHSELVVDPRSKPRARRPVVLGVLSAEERRLFLEPGRQPLPALPAELVWAGEESSPRSASFYRHVAPEVLLTGWSTGSLPREWLDSPDCSLRYVCHLAGSVRRFLPRSFIERGGWVTNWGNIPSGAVAEHALLLALAALRNLAAWPQIIRQAGAAGSHIERLHTRTLFRRRVGLHGFGRVARALVPLLRPFAVEIQAYSAGVPADHFRAAGIGEARSLRELFATSEIIFECEAWTPATTGCVSSEVLAALPREAIFVNVGRGQVVDEAALLREAAAGRIRVALDVVESEPLVPASAFCQLPGAVLSPHIGGPTFDQYPRCGEHAWRNIARFLEGETLKFTVSLADYDRAT
jgi:phosphoglycerate dehydrogenase-like enzyme